MATHMPMATARQPFAPLNSSRLQNLTSLKNRQNALSSTLSPASKRKAQTFEDDNAENIDPIIFISPKRSKAQDGSSKNSSSFVKPVNFFLTPALPSPNDFPSLKPVVSSRRPILAAKSQLQKLNTTLTKEKSIPQSAPAGRSPTRKRIGILNRHRKSTPFQRVDPPKFNTPSAPSGLGFSIDAALSGTIPSYTPRSRVSPPVVKEALPVPVLHTPEPKDSWFFDIHEDTAEELATNLMEHSTCTLDISSDEESFARMMDERGKENVPPMDDVSQTRTVLSSVATVDLAEQGMSELKATIKLRREKCIDENACDIDRSPLSDLAAEDFYAEGCDGSSVYIIPSEEAEVEVEAEAEAEAEIPQEQTTAFDLTPIVDEGKSPDLIDIIDALMQKDEYEIAPKAALLEPLPKAEDNFEVWESGSAKDDGEC